MAFSYSTHPHVIHVVFTLITEEGYSEQLRGGVMKLLTVLNEELVVNFSEPMRRGKLLILMKLNYN